MAIFIGSVVASVRLSAKGEYDSIQSLSFCTLHLTGRKPNSQPLNTIM